MKMPTADRLATLLTPPPFSPLPSHSLELQRPQQENDDDDEPVHRNPLGESSFDCEKEWNGSGGVPVLHRKKKAHV
jgi:hypothetical protein